MEGERTHTFLFADLAGFTALTEAMGDAHAVEAVEGFFSEARSHIAKHDAEEVKTIGDALMIRGNDAADAIGLGLCLVYDVGASHLVPAVRVGIHTGSAIRRDDDWFGGTVNLAARTCGAAANDEVLLTGATREAAGELEGVALVDYGRVELRNVVEPVNLYRALREGAQLKGLPMDPVCRMAVDPKHEAGSLVHAGVEYHFCSLHCAEQFAHDPDRYIALAES